MEKAGNKWESSMSIDGGDPPNMWFLSESTTDQHGDLCSLLEDDIADLQGCFDESPAIWKNSAEGRRVHAWLQRLRNYRDLVSELPELPEHEPSVQISDR